MFNVKSKKKRNPPSPKDRPGYGAFRDKQARISSERSRSGRDIADDRPDCANPERRKLAADSLEFFSRTYLAGTFSLPWSPDHRTAISKLETAVRHGGQFGYAMPRGSGKTSLAEAASLWAALFGLRRFVVAIGSDQSSALEMLDSIKVELESNNLLDEDFHFACGPIRKLDGIAHRCNGQLWKGLRTHIHWTNETIVFPTIPGSTASGAIISVSGLTGRIRGMKFKRPDGVSARPDLCVLDDPQTDESARSPSQVQARERLVSGAVMGLAGPGKKIAAVMPCTIISQGDLADRILDGKKHPEWQGERAKLIYEFPTDTVKWEQYAQYRADSLRAGNGGREATEFYRANREVMDAGARAAWQDRYNPDEISALQHAINLKLDLGDAAFAAEYQNAPLTELVGEEMLSVDEICKKINGVPRGQIPAGINHLTAFIDVQGKCLYWMVCGWGEGFQGAIIDYGAFPDQKRAYFSLADIKQTLARMFPTAGKEGQIYAGLDALTAMLLPKIWTRADGAEMRITKCLIDANWETDIVKKFCRQTHHPIVMPSHGRGVGASQMPWDQFTARAGEQLGYHWKIVTGKIVRHVDIDINFYKSFIQNRLRTMLGDKGCLSLYGHKPDDHRMLAEHFNAEYGVRTSGRGREVVEYRLKVNKPDNHFWDCIVGCACAASMLGVSIAAMKVKKVIRRRREATYYN